MSHPDTVTPADVLADQLRRGQHGSLAAYLELRRPALLGYIEQRLGAALRSKVEPEDLYQELAVKALRELPQTDLSSRDPFGWLCFLSEQCIVDWHRHFAAKKRASGREISGNIHVGEGSQDFIAMLAASLTSPTQASVRGERQRRLNEALATFPDDQREALKLRYVDGLPTKDVAARMGKTDVATRVLLSRLIQRLQEMLGGG